MLWPFLNICSMRKRIFKLCQDYYKRLIFVQKKVRAVMSLRFTQMHMLRNHFIKAFIDYKDKIDEEKSPKLVKNMAKFNWDLMENFISCWLLRCVLRSMEESMKW